MKAGLVVGTTLSIAAGTFGACGDDASLADGTLQVTIYGEELIEDEIPANDVADGWRINFTRFLVVVKHVSLGRDGEGAALAMAESRVYDLAKPSNGLGHLVATLDTAGGVYDVLAYDIAPGGPLTIGNATQRDVDEMTTNGYSVLVEGTGQKGGETKSFTWGFLTSTRYEPCATAAKVDGGTGVSQITIHADHLFYDSLVSETPDMRFQLIADADGDDDGEVTLAELAGVDITTLTNYQVGNATHVKDLAAFIAAQVPAIGHVDGEGHCAIKP